MLKYVLAGLFILILTALLQHPVPILEGVEVYSEQTQTITNNSKKENKIEEEEDFYLPQANIDIPNSELIDYQ